MISGRPTQFTGSSRTGWPSDVVVYTVSTNGRRRSPLHQFPCAHAIGSRRSTVLRMFPGARSSLLSLVAVGVLAISTSGCSAEGAVRRDAAVDPKASPTVAAAPAEPSRVTLMQKLSTTGTARNLYVEADGRWSCEDCAGDGKTTSGALTADQLTQLQTLLANPALAQETEQKTRYQLSCLDGLISTLITSQGLITFSDCPGEQRPKAAGPILALLADATPASATR
jgi:hypothetical protein